MRGRSVAYLSIGDCCQTADQIRRFFRTKDAYFFDWLITPIHALAAFNAPDETFFQSEKWTVNESGDAIEDQGTGLIFHHQFEVDDAHLIRIEKVEEQLEEARSKFMYLREKTCRRWRLPIKLFS